MRLVGEQGEERLVLGELAAEGVHEHRDTLAIGVQQGLRLVPARHQLAEKGTPVHEVHGIGARPQPSVPHHQLPRVHQPAAPPRRLDRLAQDLLVRARLHLRPVHDRDDPSPAARHGGQHRAHQRGDRGRVADRPLARERTEGGQLLEHRGHAVAVAEARRRVVVHLEEARPVGREERVDPREQHVGRARVEGDPRRVRRRAGRARRRAGGRRRRRRGARRPRSGPASAGRPRASRARPAGPPGAAARRCASACRRR